MMVTVKMRNSIRSFWMVHFELVDHFEAEDWNIGKTTKSNPGIIEEWSVE